MEGLWNGKGGMLVELSPLWIALANVIAVPVIHFGLSWLYTRMPVGWFDPNSAIFRDRGWESGGEVYQSVFGIRRWKKHLPDAAPWFGGFAKGSLRDMERGHLEEFIVETCRGEAAHYAQVVGLWVTVVWNPWPVAALVMIVYAVLSNLPCILLQRFTRARLRHFLANLDRLGKESQGSSVADR